MCKLLLICRLLISSAERDFKVASIFQNSTTLQRDLPVLVWSIAKPGSSVKVEWLGEASADGQWKVTLKPNPMGGPNELSFSSGSNKLALKDILLGEVWICSEQSNMVMGYKKNEDFSSIIEESKNLPIRSLIVEQFVALEKQSSFNGKWKKEICASAVGTSFAYYLQKKLGLPVGIIQSA